MSEKNGRWSRAEEIPGTAKLNVGGFARVLSVSCRSAGNCGAGGWYQNHPRLPGSGYNSFEAFVVSERNGRWATAEEVPGLAALNTTYYPDAWTRSVSCAWPGNCTAGGFYYDVYGGEHPFVVSEKNGSWGRLARPNVGGSVSCWRAGDCTVAGSGQAPVSLSPIFGFVETETNGRWGKAHQFASRLNLGIGSVSCPSAGNCAAGGDQGSCECDAGYSNDAFVFSEHNGRWGMVDYLTGPASLGTVTSLWCASAGNCGAGGSGYAGNDENGNELTQAFVVGERDGRWTAAETPPGEAALNLGANPNSQVNSVSCPSASACVVGGYYTDPAGHTQAFVDGSK